MCSTPPQVHRHQQHWVWLQKKAHQEDLGDDSPRHELGEHSDALPG